MARILIVGCGYVGIPLGLRLVEQGHDVFGVRRRPAQLPPAIRPIQADVSTSTGLVALPRDLDTVVYMVSADRPDDESYKRSYVDGVANILRALGNANLRHFCFVSSTAVYGQRDGSVVDETSPTQPTTYRGTRVLQGEHLVLDSPFEPLIARSAGIYGPGRSRMIDLIRAGKQPSVDAETYGNRIHRDDLAAALAHLIQLEHPDSHYVCCDREPAVTGDVIRWIADQVGCPATSNRPTEKKGTANKRCSSTRLQRSGFVFQYPSYREGYAALLAGPSSSSSSIGG